MSRLLLAGSLAAATLGAIAAFPAAADRSFHSRLDDEGKAIAPAWSDTARFDKLMASGMDDVSMTTGAG